jgi:hypothetical protein
VPGARWQAGTCGAGGRRGADSDRFGHACEAAGPSDMTRQLEVVEGLGRKDSDHYTRTRTNARPHGVAHAHTRTATHTISLLMMRTQQRCARASAPVSSHGKHLDSCHMRHLTSRTMMNVLKYDIVHPTYDSLLKLLNIPYSTSYVRCYVRN